MSPVYRCGTIVGVSSLWLALAGCVPADPDERPSVSESIHASLAQREYRASENGEGLQAPNRRHNLRTYFEPDGIRVVDRTAAGSPRLLDLTLSGVGRGDALRAVPAGRVHVDEARVEIRRPGLVEWFVNGPDGLEQGFTLAERPEGDGKLVLELRLDGAQAKARGEELVFATQTGRRLSYGKLIAWDARGTPLAAQLEAPDTLRVTLAIDDSGAHYPIVIDPLLSEAADGRLEGDQDVAQLGESVASAGDVNGDGYADVIAGAPFYDNGSNNEGAAFIFLGSPGGVPDAGALSAQTQLESDQADAAFGISVASAGDVNGDGYDDVIVGAYLYDLKGAAYVFLGGPLGVASASPATAHAQLVSEQFSSALGFSVASAGDVNGDGYADVIVGSYGYTSGHANEGAAFVFLGSATGVADATTATAHARLESNQADALLGLSVAGAGDVNGDGYSDVIVGAPEYENVVLDEGAAFIFLGSATGIAAGNPATAHALLRSNQAAADFGQSVAAAGDVNGDGYADVIVGARSYDTSLVNTGAAFVFLGSADGVASASVFNAHAQLDGDQSLAQFGGSVGSAGDVNGDGYGDLIVGAPLYSNGQNSEGAAFVFLGSVGGVADGGPGTAYAQLESDLPFANLGTSVAGAGDVNGDGYGDVIVGARTYANPQPAEGGAFVYHGGANGISDGNPANAATRLESNEAAADFGASVASAGDVNGDGYGDVIVGAPLYDAGGANAGAAFVFHGSATGVATAVPITANTELVGNQAGAALGRSVASAGDVNGDGYGDVIVGAPMYDAPESNEGAAFVFLGSASGVADATPAAAHARLEGDQELANLGQSVAAAGDVNGDGYGDVIVGAPMYDAPESNEGAAFVFLGSASGMVHGNPTNAHAQLESNLANAVFGFSVASAGDVNGDGYADVIVGAFNYANGSSGEGAAFAFLGSASGIADGNPANAHARFEANLTNANLGLSVASAGDVNGDGYADVILGAPGYDAGQPSEGAAFIFHGSASGLPNGGPSTVATILQGDQSGASMGGGVAGAGDVNGDGFADVIVGASGFDDGSTNEGAAFIFLGSASGVANGSALSAHPRLESDQGGALLGESVASAGDVNGDGYADVIVGARSYDAPQVNEGAAFVFQGNGNRDGRGVLVRQRRGDGSGIAVQPWGGAQTNRFVAELSGSHPQGRGRVRGQIQACPAGVPFGGAGCVNVLTPGWVTVNAPTPDVALSQMLTDLLGNRLYRWRARVLRAPATGPTPANPPHGPWRRLGAQSIEADLRTGAVADADADGVPDAADNCPTVANASQADGDADGVGDACDNCTARANPRVAGGFLATNPWATLTGGQRDDDHDGYGNACDAKFAGGVVVGSTDLTQFRASNGKSRTGDTCGTEGTRPCAIFDLDESGALIGSGDLAHFRLLNGKAPGPRCATCPLPCEAGASGSCF